MIEEKLVRKAIKKVCNDVTGISGKAGVCNRFENRLLMELGL